MKKGIKILKWIVLGVIFIGLVGWVTMALWNWLIPDLFNGPAIGFWQALGLFALSKILFWGFGGKRHHHSSKGHWRHRYYDKLSSMTPEERAVFRQKMKEKWCSK
jgi:hypothetical protein